MSMISSAGRAHFRVTQDGHARLERGLAGGLEAPAFLLRHALVRGAHLDHAGARLIKRQCRICPIGRMHAALDVRDHPITEHLS